MIEIRRTLSTASVKGEENQEKVRWLDPKTKHGIREIPIAAELISALRTWKEKCPQSRLELVFCNEFGEPCERAGIGRYGLAPALTQARIEKNVTMHGLRHSYASMLILLGRPITEVSRYIEHARRVNHDESLCSLPEAQEAGRDERSGKADSECVTTLAPISLAQVGTV